MLRYQGKQKHLVRMESICHLQETLAYRRKMYQCIQQSFKRNFNQYAIEKSVTTFSQELQYHIMNTVILTSFAVKNLLRL
jgi:hypothetical protein